MKTSRRNFLKKAGTASALLSVGGVLPGMSAASYGRIVGANERIRLMVKGVNGRGLSLATSLAQMNECEVATICDVDTRALDKCVEAVKKEQNTTPKGEKDFRRSLADKNIDGVVIATPDHWHTPGALLALQAGKHVYVEKPVSHTPREGEMLVEATAKYGKVVQVGSQRRSWPYVVEAINEIRRGVIGKVHHGKAWYSNSRASIGIGKVARVPDWLDWNLWQGPAPHTVYKDNIVHYNWHWFWHWGTAESAANGVHLIDMLVWGMDVKFPKKINSIGGRYYHNDDWECPDTQIINMEYDNALISVETNSCNGKNTHNAGVGVMFYGDAGSLMIGANDYTIFNHRNQVVKEKKGNNDILLGSTVNPSRHLDAIHFLNFFDGIRKGTPQACTAEDGHLGCALMLIGNIAMRTGRTLNLNPANGHIIGDSEAQRFWSRDYEPGWEPKI